MTAHDDAAIQRHRWAYVVDRVLYGDPGIRSKIEEIGHDTLLADIPADRKLVDEPVGRWCDRTIEERPCKEYELVARSVPRAAS